MERFSIGNTLFPFFLSAFLGLLDLLGLRLGLLFCSHRICKGKK